MNPIFQMVKEAASSKKFIVTVAGTITAALMKINLEMETEAVAAVIAPVVAYIIGQGWADSGKEAAKVQGTTALALEDREPPQAVKDKLL